MAFDLGKALDAIRPTTVTPDLLEAIGSEAEFNRIGVELLVETAAHVYAAASITPTPANCWNRDQAIVGGHAVRLYKLLLVIADQTSQNRREVAFAFQRLAFETIVNLRFLVSFASPELFDSYVRYSLRHEKRLFDRIHANIQARGGAVTPIEARMLRSIARTEETSGVSIDSIAANAPKNWGGRNIYERAKAVGLEEPYSAVFGGGSHTVHGNWMNLLDYHLLVVDGGFRPRLRWRRPRPQPLFATVLLTIEALREYIAYAANSDASLLTEPRLLDLWQRNRLADEAHERFLQRVHD